MKIECKHTFSCVTSCNSLSDTLQIAIDQAGATESNKEDQKSVANGEGNRKWSSDDEFNTDEHKRLCEQITNTFDDTMTLENLLKVFHNKRANIIGDSYDYEFKIGQAANTNKHNGAQEAQENADKTKDLSSDSLETNSTNLVSDKIVRSSDRKTVNNLLTFQAEVTVTAAADQSNSEEAATEPKRKRKLEYIADIDFESKNVVSKQSRQANERENVPSGMNR